MEKQKINELKKEKLEKLKKAEKNIEEMLKYKNKKLLKASLTIVVEDMPKPTTIVFQLSTGLGKKTLLADIEEDQKKLELVKKQITKKIKEVEK